MLISTLDSRYKLKKIGKVCHKVKKVINYLYNHPFVSIIVLLTYYLLVVLPHEQVTLFIEWFIEVTSWEVYQRIVSISGLLLFFLSLFFIIRNIQHNDNKMLTITYLVITVLMMIVSFYILIIFKIEIIHFAQYAALAILLFPLTKKFSDTMFWATIMGFIDESFQYFYLTLQGTDYFDFNDVILNLIGAGFGIVFIYSLGFRPVKDVFVKWYKSPVFITIITIIITIFVLIQSSIMAVYPSDNKANTVILLVKTTTQGFWVHTEYLNIKYHIVQPLEGCIIISLLMAFYFLLDLKWNKKNKQ